jgi:hypothetical protein
MTTQSEINPAARAASIAIISVIVALVLAAAGWSFVSSRIHPKDYELTEVMPPAVTAYQIAQGVAANNGIPNPNIVQMRGGDFNFVAVKNGDKWTLRLNYTKELLPADQSAALLARFRLANDAAFAKSLNVTDDQIKQLKDIPLGTGLIINDPDRARIHKAWDAYAADRQPANESELTKTIQEVGDASLQPTRTALGDRAAKVQSILKPEQIAPFKQ